MEQRILRLADVERKTGLRKSAIYNGIAAGTFPRPIQLTARARGWRCADIDEWIASRPKTDIPQHASA